MTQPWQAEPDIQSIRESVNTHMCVQTPTTKQLACPRHGAVLAARSA
jgi:hypothetical protein